MLIVYRPLESLSLQKSPETKNMIEKVLKKKKKNYPRVKQPIKIKTSAIQNRVSQLQSQCTSKRKNTFKCIQMVHKFTSN